jgi:hypothetical protein
MSSGCRSGHVVGDGRASSGDKGARNLGDSSASGRCWESGVDRAVMKDEGDEGPVLDSPGICIVMGSRESRDWGTLIDNRVSILILEPDGGDGEGKVE